MKDMFPLITSDEKGFTLIEIMVAVAIMAIAFTAVIGVHSQSVTMNMASNFHAQAPLLAKKLISEWEVQMAVSGSAVPLNDALDAFQNYSYEITDREIESEWLFSETTQKNHGRIIELTCTIYYNDGEYQYTAKALKLIAP
jgi:prepilin-type N-terminal cleavage/methylation domain-containing protein